MTLPSRRLADKMRFQEGVSASQANETNQRLSRSEIAEEFSSSMLKDLLRIGVGIPVRARDWWSEYGLGSGGFTDLLGVPTPDAGETVPKWRTTRPAGFSLQYDTGEVASGRPEAFGDFMRFGGRGPDAAQYQGLGYREARNLGMYGDSYPVHQPLTEEEHTQNVANQWMAARQRQLLREQNIQRYGMPTTLRPTPSELTPEQTEEMIQIDRAKSENVFNQQMQDYIEGNKPGLHRQDPVGQLLSGVAGGFYTKIERGIAWGTDPSDRQDAHARLMENSEWYRQMYPNAEKPLERAGQIAEELAEYMALYPISTTAGGMIAGRYALGKIAQYGLPVAIEAMGSGVVAGLNGGNQVDVMNSVLWGGAGAGVMRAVGMLGKLPENLIARPTWNKVLRNWREHHRQMQDIATLRQRGSITLQGERITDPERVKEIYRFGQKVSDEMFDAAFKLQDGRGIIAFARQSLDDLVGEQSNYAPGSKVGDYIDDLFKGAPDPKNPRPQIRDVQTGKMVDMTSPDQFWRLMDGADIQAAEAFKKYVLSPLGIKGPSTKELEILARRGAGLSDEAGPSISRGGKVEGAGTPVSDAQAAKQAAAEAQKVIDNLRGTWQPIGDETTKDAYNLAKELFDMSPGGRVGAFKPEALTARNALRMKSLAQRAQKFNMDGSLLGSGEPTTRAGAALQGIGTELDKAIFKFGGRGLKDLMEEASANMAVLDTIDTYIKSKPGMLQAMLAAMFGVTGHAVQAGRHGAITVSKEQMRLLQVTRAMSKGLNWSAIVPSKVWIEAETARSRAQGTMTPATQGIMSIFGLTEEQLGGPLGGRPPFDTSVPERYEASGGTSMMAPWGPRQLGLEEGAPVSTFTGSGPERLWIPLPLVPDVPVPPPLLRGPGAVLGAVGQFLQGETAEGMRRLGRGLGYEMYTDKNGVLHIGAARGGQ